MTDDIHFASRVWRTLPVQLAAKVSPIEVMVLINKANQLAVQSGLKEGTHV